MIRIAILGDIGSGKSYVAKLFGYPVFDADSEVTRLYKKSKRCYKKLKKALPAHIVSFPVKKNELSQAIISDQNNLKKIVKIVHLEIKKKMNVFLKKNKNKNIVILDIPLLLENKINKKNDILVFVQSKKSDITKKLRKRTNFNLRLLNKFKKIQLPLDYKRKKSQFIIKNNFTKKSVKRATKNILKEIL